MVFLLVVSHQQCYLLWDPSRLPLPSKPTKSETDQTNSQRWTSPNGEPAKTHHDREAHGLYSTRYRREARLWKSPHGSNAGVGGQIPGTLRPAWCRQEAAGCCGMLRDAARCKTCCCKVVLLPRCAGAGGWVGSLLVGRAAGSVTRACCHLFVRVCCSSPC